MAVFSVGAETKDKEIRSVASGLTALTIVARDCSVGLLKVDDEIPLGSGELVVYQDLVLDPEFTHVRITGTGDSSRCSLFFHPARR